MALVEPYKPCLTSFRGQCYSVCSSHLEYGDLSRGGDTQLWGMRIHSHRPSSGTWPWREGLWAFRQDTAIFFSDLMFSPAQLLLAVTQLSKSLPGGLEGSSWVFPLYSVPFETLQSNTGLGKAVFFPPLVCLRGHLVGNWHISDFVLMQTRSLNAVHQH